MQTKRFFRHKQIDFVTDSTAQKKNVIVIRYVRKKHVWNKKTQACKNII